MLSMGLHFRQVPQGNF